MPLHHAARDLHVERHIAAEPHLLGPVLEIEEVAEEAQRLFGFDELEPKVLAELLLQRSGRFLKFGKQAAVVPGMLLRL